MTWQQSWRKGMRNALWFALVWMLLMAYRNIWDYAQTNEAFAAAHWSVRFLIEILAVACGVIALNLYAVKVHDRRCHREQAQTVQSQAAQGTYPRVVPHHRHTEDGDVA